MIVLSDGVMLALRKTVVSSRDMGFSKLSRSHHQSGVQSCCWLSVSSLICVNWLVGHATFLLTIRLKWHNSIVIGQFQSINNVRLLTNHYHHFDVIVNLEEVIIALNMKAIFAIKNTTIAVKKKKKKKAHLVSKLLTSLIPMQSFTNWANKHYC